MVDDLRTEHKGKILAVKDLPTLPTVLDEVTKLVEDPNSSTEHIAKVISYDQVLSAKVLKMVNSPIYGFPGRISSIQHALVLLGFNVIRGVIISTSVFDVMTSSMVGLWDHSVGCAIACTEIAKAAKLKDPEEYSVSGLLHDLGKVVCAVQLPEAKKQIDAEIKEKDLSYIEAENDILGFGHDRINAWLSDHWHLPSKIKEGITHHHTPLRAEHYPAFPSVVHLGNFVVRLLEYGSGGDDNVSHLDPKAMKLLKLKVLDLERVLDVLGEKFIEVSDLSFS